MLVLLPRFDSIVFAMRVTPMSAWSTKLQCAVRCTKFRPPQIRNLEYEKCTFSLFRRILFQFLFSFGCKQMLD